MPLVRGIGPSKIKQNLKNPHKLCEALKIT